MGQEENPPTNVRRYALITGASSGIGREIARRLAARKYDLILVSRNEAALNELRESLRDGRDIQVVPWDLAMPGAAQALHAEMRRRELPVEILVNNAGYGLLGPHVDLDYGEVERMLALNVIALTTLSSLFGREMRDRGAGYILNVASVAAYQPAPRTAAYAASKSYVLHFSIALGKELAPRGVSVTCVSPGATDTGFFARAGFRDDAKGLLSPKNRMSAERVAEAALKAMFERRASVVPGPLNAIAATLGRAAPLSWSAGVAKAIAERA